MKQQVLSQILKVSNLIIKQRVIILTLLAAVYIGLAINSINVNSGDGREETHYQASLLDIKSFKFDD